MAQELKVIPATEELHVIRINTLVGDKPLTFPVYIKLADRYIMYVRSGDVFESNRLNHLKEKKLKKLFILPEHEEVYRAYLEQNLEEAYDLTYKKDPKDRAQVLAGDQERRAEEFIHDPSQKSFEAAQEGITKFYNILKTDDRFLRELLHWESVNSSVAQHGVRVATLVLGWMQKKPDRFNEADQSILGLGALLHDLAHVQSLFSWDNPRHELTPEARKQYREHPKLGSEWLMRHDFIPAAVRQIVEQHEETLDGKGFPQGIDKIDPMALLIGMANFVDLLLHVEKVASEDLSKRIMMEGVGKYPLEDLKLMAKLVKDLR